ncbi:MAG: hypothetical protein PUA57_04320 [Eggerthellales bacterium]|nr:hypothetical protein [Eggerthellales bacterium]
MATEEEILAEVEQLGRLSQRAEDVMYNITLRQDELGREPSNMLLSKLKEDPIYQEMIDREMITYDVYGSKAMKDSVVSLYVTLKGIRYCILFGDEIHARRKVDPAGRLKSNL